MLDNAVYDPYVYKRKYFQTKQNDTVFQNNESDKVKQKSEKRKSHHSSAI